MEVKFEMTQGPGGKGVTCTFTNGSGVSSTTYFNAPVMSISHVCPVYMKGRFWNVRDKRQMDFIKRRYAEEITKFCS